MQYVLEGVNLTKVYRIYRKPSDRLKEIFFRRKYHIEKIALENVSIKLREGEVLGIVGENGAGKSTLLSILAGTLSPTKGEVKKKGKIAAILELGAGFHPDLSGYDNVLMYASMLGIPIEHIKKKMDFIEDFAELKGVMDRPIKTYSTGMVVRLAFSTMLACEPSVFIIDEALSVGDIHFQHKSFNAIRDYRNNGGSIIFTTHSLYQITNICDRALWLKDGIVQLEGDPLAVVKEFEDYMRQKNTDIQGSEAERYEVKSKTYPYAWIDSVEVNSSVIKPEEDLQIRIHINSLDELSVHVGVVLKRIDGLWVAVYSTRHEGKVIRLRGASRVTFTFKRIPLLYGKYNVEVYLLNEEGTVVYDIKSVPIDIIKTSVLDLGVFRVRGEINVESFQ